MTDAVPAFAAGPRTVSAVPGAPRTPSTPSSDCFAAQLDAIAPSPTHHKFDAKHGAGASPEMRSSADPEHEMAIGTPDGESGCKPPTCCGAKVNPDGASEAEDADSDGDALDSSGSNSPAPESIQAFLQMLERSVAALDDASGSETLSYTSQGSPTTLANDTPVDPAIAAQALAPGSTVLGGVVPMPGAAKVVPQAQFLSGASLAPGVPGAIAMPGAQEKPPVALSEVNPNPVLAQAALPEPAQDRAAGPTATLPDAALAQAVDQAVTGAGDRPGPLAGVVATPTTTALPQPPPGPPAPGPLLPQTPLNLQDERWAVDLGNRLLWSARDGVQEATLQLHPQELGTVDVRISIDAGQVRVDFQSAQPAVRAALQAGLVQLQALFAGEGLQLAQTRIGHGGSRSASPSSSGESGSFWGEPSTSLLRPRARRIGALDQYA
ncbi:MAG: flagellar hook-length control protein FliK [Panacagrimonas sp.]